MNLRTFSKPLPFVAVGGARFNARAAFRDETGLLVTVEAANGQVQDASTFLLTTPDTRMAFAEQVAPRLHISVPAAADALAQHAPLADTRLREDLAEAPWDDPVPFSAANLPPFPDAALVDALGDFARASAVQYQVPVDLPAMLCLAVVATCCARKVVIRLREGWTEPTNIYAAVTLGSGERKSPVFKETTAPLTIWEQAETERLREQIAEEASRYRCLVHESSGFC
jgi:hypothetical protein